VTLFFEIAGGGAAGNSIGNDRVRLTMPPLTIRAEAGDVGISGITFDDPDDFIGTTHTPLGIRGFAVSETAASPDKIFQGYFADRTIKRGESPRGSLRIGAQREWDASLLDLNNAVFRRVIRNSDGNRPAETDLARISWLLGSAYTSNLADYGLVATTGAIDMDAADYRGRYPADVLTDCGAASGRNWFVYIDDGAQNGPWALAYFDATGTSFTTSIKVSNVLSDVDRATVFEPNEQAELLKDPSQLYSGVFLQYAGGSVYRENTTTFTGLDKRDIAIDDPNIKTRASAIIRADRYLAQYATEAETLKYTITVPAATVNAVRAGQRQQVKFSHLPGYTSYTYVRIVTLTVSQHENTDAYYDLAIEAKSPKLVAGTRIAPPSAGNVNNQIPPVGASIAITTCTDKPPTADSTVLGDLVVTHGTPDASANFNGWTTSALHPTPGRYLTAEITESAGDQTNIDGAGIGLPPQLAYVHDGSGNDWCCKGGPTDPGTLLYWQYDGSTGGLAPLTGREFCLLTWTDGGVANTWHAWPADGTLVSNGAFGAGRDAAFGIMAGGHFADGATGSFTVRIREYDTVGPAGAPALGQPSGEQTPTPAPDGVTTTFTTPANFFAGTLRVEVDGIDETDAVTSSTANTFTLSFAPESDEVVKVWYSGAGTG
jgi:hypothetical protein